MPDDSAGCGLSALDNASVPGEVALAPGANRAGAPLQSLLLRFAAQMAAVAGHPLIVTTGSNHSQYTVDGNVSDHWDGYAADFGMTANGGSDDSPIGDRIMFACLPAAGVPETEAADEAQRGGLYTIKGDGLRFQCIWKTDAGGTITTTVHAAARPT